MKYLTTSFRTDVDPHSGKMKTFKDLRLAEAVSITDAEATTVQYAGSGVSVDAVRKYKVSEIIYNEKDSSLPFYKAIVGIETFNEKSKKIKLTKTVVLVQANSVLDAVADVIAAWGKSTDWEILEVKKTPILEIIEPAKAA